MSEYIATTESGWGRGFGSENAVAKALVHSQPAETTTVWLYRVDGFEDVWPGDGGIRADEVHSEEKFELSRSDVKTIVKLSGELELMVDTILGESYADR